MSTSSITGKEAEDYAAMMTEHYAKFDRAFRRQYKNGTIKRTVAKLRPCPFCGEHTIDILPQQGHYLIRCTMCGCRMTSYSYLMAQIEDEWNARRPNGA